MWCSLSEVCVISGELLRKSRSIGMGRICTEWVKLFATDKEHPWKGERNPLPRKQTSVQEKLPPPTTIMISISQIPGTPFCLLFDFCFNLLYQGHISGVL